MKEPLFPEGKMSKDWMLILCMRYITENRQMIEDLQKEVIDLRKIVEQQEEVSS